MKLVSITSIARVTLVAILCLGNLCPVARGAQPENNSPIPAVIRAGFDFFEKRHPERGVDTWKVGGLVGEENRGISHASYFKEAEQTLGKYQAYDWVTTKPIGKTSKIVYLAINYERGAVYGRFLMYLRDKDWVVQGMNFNTRPEALMPWLAFDSEQ